MVCAWFLGKKPDCKSKFSQKELSELRERCNNHKKQKKLENEKKSYQKRKKAKNETSPSPSTSNVHNSETKAEQSKVLKPTEVMCLGCQKNFPYSSINYHLNMKLSCKSLYSETEYADLQRVCDLHKREKKAMYKSISYHQKQSQKFKSDVIARSKEEIDTIIKTMREIRDKSMYHCMFWLSEFVKMYVCMLRDMKKFFSNHALVEMDIQKYIATTFIEINDVYDHSMKEIVWTFKFLLANPSVSIDQEVADLKTYLSGLSLDLDSYVLDFVRDNLEAYENNIMRQLPEKIRKKFQKRIDCEYYNRDRDIEPFPEYILYPFQDPAKFWYFNDDPSVEKLPLHQSCYKEYFVDEVILCINHLCKACGKSFSSVLKHLRSPSVSCDKHYNKKEMDEMKEQPEEESKSNILQMIFDDVKELKYLINESIELNFDAHCIDIFSLLSRAQIVRSKEFDMPNLFDKYNVPANLVTKHKESVKQANEMYDVLEEEYFNLKSQVIDEFNQISQNELEWLKGVPNLIDGCGSIGGDVDLQDTHDMFHTLLESLKIPHSYSLKYFI